MYPGIRTCSDTNRPLTLTTLSHHPPSSTNYLQLFSHHPNPPCGWNRAVGVSYRTGCAERDGDFPEAGEWEREHFPGRTAWAKGDPLQIRHARGEMKLVKQLPLACVRLFCMHKCLIFLFCVGRTMNLAGRVVLYSRAPYSTWCSAQLCRTVCLSCMHTSLPPYCAVLSVYYSDAMV